MRRHLARLASIPAIATLERDWKNGLWLTFLVVASVAFTLGFACAVPFAAFGASAALTLGFRSGVLLTAAVWFVNQCVGFAFLGYPWTGMTFAWGIALGFVAVLTFAVAHFLVNQTEHHSRIVVAPTAFAGAFVAYEGSLFVISATLLGGAEIYTFEIMMRILWINAAAFIGLLAVDRLAALAGVGAKPAYS